MAMCFLPASVTCRSRGGEGGPEKRVKHSHPQSHHQALDNILRIINTTYLLDLQFSGFLWVRLGVQLQLHSLPEPETGPLFLQ